MFNRYHFAAAWCFAFLLPSCADSQFNAPPSTAEQRPNTDDTDPAIATTGTGKSGPTKSKGTDPATAEEDSTDAIDSISGEGDPGEDDSGNSGDETSGKNNSLDDEGGNKADICDVPSGDSKTNVSLGGEDVPGNGLVGGPDSGHTLGSDFDDYTLAFNGRMIINRGNSYNGEIAIEPGEKVDVAYSRGTTDCSHEFDFIFRRCPNKSSSEVARQVMTVGRGNSGSIQLNAPKKAAFLDIVMRVSRSSTRQFGGCMLPLPLENRLYNSLQPGFVIR